MNNSVLYRPCVGIALFNKDGRVFVGQRIDTPGAWQMPQGGVNENEAIETAVLRELKEEIGTDHAEVLHVASETLKYDLPPVLQKKLWDGRYKGQEQTWVAARFTGTDADIALDLDEHPEFDAWQWVDLPRTLDLIVPFKRDTYLKVIEMFSEFSK